MLVPDAVRARLAAHAAELRARAPRLAWVPADNLHLTIRFLGEVDAATVGRAAVAMRRAAAAVAPFHVALAGLGGFPPGRAARVVWAGVGEGTAPLAALHRGLEAALVAEGLPPERRAFHAHVTLARARTPGGTRGLEGALGAPVAFGAFRVEALHLMRSDLGPAGARYRVLAEARLGEEPEHSSSVDISGQTP